MIMFLFFTPKVYGYLNRETNYLPRSPDATDVTVTLVARTQRKAKGVMISTDGSKGLDDFQQPRRGLELLSGIELEKKPLLYRSQNHAKDGARGMHMQVHGTIGGWGHVVVICCFLLDFDRMRNAQCASLNAQPDAQSRYLTLIVMANTLIPALLLKCSFVLWFLAQANSKSL